MDLATPSLVGSAHAGHDEPRLYQSRCESQCDLLGNARTGPVWITSFHLDNASGPGRWRRFGENSNRYFRFLRI